MRWRWQSGRAAPRTSLVWFITPTAACQYLAIRYTERLADAGAVCSVGSRGDSYDNAMAESVNGLYKTEVIRKQGPWRSFEQLELATARWVEWYNRRRLHSSIGGIPPAEFEEAYYRDRVAREVA
jgi:putative transposase